MHTNTWMDALEIVSMAAMKSRSTVLKGQKAIIEDHAFRLWKGGTHMSVCVCLVLVGGMKMAQWEQ